MRILALPIALLLAAACPRFAFAQYGPPGDSSSTSTGGGSYGAGGGYSLMRWDEDYSYLKNASASKDMWDPIKFVPLSADGSSYLSFGGQARYRYDYFNNPTFGPGKNDEDGFHLQRYLAHADVHLGEHLRFFVQGDASFVDGRSGGGRYGDADHGDLTQAFVDLKTAEDSDVYAFLRLGRQELIYGSQRLISPDDWRNVRRSFDGGKVSISIPNNTTEMFLTVPVFIETEQFDNDDNTSTFAGIYNSTALPDFLPDAGTKLDLYGLALYQTPASSLNNLHADAKHLHRRLHGSRPDPNPSISMLRATISSANSTRPTSPPGPSPARPATPFPGSSPRGHRSASTSPAAPRTPATGSTSSSHQRTTIWATSTSSAAKTWSTPMSVSTSTSTRTSRFTSRIISTGVRTMMMASTASRAPW